MGNQLCLKLEGLCCVNCAEKIEKKISALENVSDVSLNFMVSELKLKYQMIEKSNLINIVTNIVKEIEPDVFVKEKNSAHVYKDIAGENNRKSDFIKYSLGAILYTLALLSGINGYIRILLFATAYILFGADVLIIAIKNIGRGQVLDENFLMSLSTIGAFAIGEYPEAVAVMVFYKIGETLQELAVSKSRKSIKALMDLKPEFANIEKNGDVVTVKPEDVRIGDIIVVKAGERIPLDGIVIEGSSQVDVSSLIGESLPRTVRKGDETLNGSINLNGLLKIEVTRNYSNSTVAKILDMAENAAAKKAPVERFITKFARIYTPVVVTLAVAIAFIPPLFWGDFTSWLSRGLVFLVVSCPCALVVSMPLSFFAGMGAASKRGILVKGGNSMQVLSVVDTVVLDKTGTLTEGVFEVIKVEAYNNYTKEDVLKTACAIEQFSNHPIAKSVLKACESENSVPISDFEEISGKGLRAVLEGEYICVGNAKLMKDMGVDFTEYKGSGTVVYVAKGRLYIGFIVISDKIKKGGIEAISALKRLGIKTIVMLTGDRKETAIEVGNQLGIDRIEAELLPYEKVEKLEELYTENSNRKIIFTGDGINDAPVLARADVGVAMGGVGTDAAIEMADIIIMTDEPKKIAEAIQLARRTMNIVKQNIAFSLLVKFAVLGFAALGLANMWMAVFADVGVTMLVVLNSICGAYYKEKL